MIEIKGSKENAREKELNTGLPKPKRSNSNQAKEEKENINIESATNAAPPKRQRSSDKQFDDPKKAKRSKLVSENNLAKKKKRSSGNIDNFLSRTKTPEHYYIIKTKWLPYEFSNYEMPLFRWTPLGYYKMRNTFQRAIHKKILRLIGVELTLGGLLFFMMLSAFTVLGGYFSMNSDEARNNSGFFTSIIASILFAFSGRNSLWIFISGISYDRMIFWHKVLGLMVLGVGIPHGLFALSGQFSISGLILLILFGIMIVFSVLIKLASYKIFLIFHRMMIPAIIIFSILHAANTILIGVGLWIFDVFVQLTVQVVNRKNVQTVSSKLKCSNIVELSFPKGEFNYKAGQFVFLKIPQISVWEPHPFSISSSPHEDYVTLHIKVVGDWTRSLGEISKRDDTSLSVYMDGPYGSPSIDIESLESDIFLIIAGGMGITTMRSIANSLLDQSSKGRSIKRLVFCWAARDLATIDSIMTNTEWLSRYNSEARIDNKSRILQLKIFLTQKNHSDSHILKTNDNAYYPFVSESKLDLKEMFQQTKDYAKSLSRSRVSVLACGPPSMLSQSSSLARQNGFQFHADNFEL